jgi:hypothetical protein
VGRRDEAERGSERERERERERESYPRRSSGLKETINVPRTQWRTNGPLSGLCEKRVSPQRLGLFSTSGDIHLGFARRVYKGTRARAQRSIRGC